MNPSATSELTSFREYLDQRLADGESELTPEAALRNWRELQESLQSIRLGLADADAGRVRPAAELLDELRARLARR
jgi:predicted transcriptional regulator